MPISNLAVLSASRFENLKQKSHTTVDNCAKKYIYGRSPVLQFQMSFPALSDQHYCSQETLLELPYCSDFHID